MNSKNADGTTIDVEEAREELLIIMYVAQFSQQPLLVSSLTNPQFRLAASDTTAGAIRSSIYRVLQIPGVYDKLMKELDEAYAAGKISRPVVTYDECIALPYFSAVVKEVLRFDPSAPTHYPRVAPKGGYNLNGFYVPEGTVVGTNSWVISRNKEIYGEDAEEFKPERWLVSEERNKMMENYSFTFGYGARICIGKNVALFEVHKLICQVRPVSVNGDFPSAYTNLHCSFSYISNPSLWTSRNMESEKTMGTSCRKGCGLRCTLGHRVLDIPTTGDLSEYEINRMIFSSSFYFIRQLE